MIQNHRNKIMKIQKIRNREKVIIEARNRINGLISKIEDLIKGSEPEYLFHLVYLFPNIFATLCKKRKINEHYFVYDITWLRATNGLTLALNKMLPKFLPLKSPSMLNLRKFKKTFESNLFYLLDACYNIGVWLYILENKYIDKLIVENEKAKPYYYGKSASIFQEYINKVAVDEGYARWLSWFYKKLKENYKLINELDAYFQREYKLRLDDIINASMYLEELVKNNRIIISRNEIHKVFSMNIRSGRAEKLLKELTFDEEGKNLYKSPLIPLKRGYFLIASWVFSLGMHFETWIRPAIESKEIYGMYTDFIGKTFEEYVRVLMEPLMDIVRSNIKITKEEYSSVKREFEIDMLAMKGKLAFLLSCKGGKRELPKLQISKMWAEFPEKEIRYRIRENKKEIKEMEDQYECIISNKEIVENLDLDGKEIIPLLVYSTIQPLSLEKLRESYNVRPLISILTVEELKNFLQQKVIKDDKL